MFIKNSRGYGLLEVLMAGAIGAIIVTGSLHGMKLSLQNSQVVQATLDDVEFRNKFKEKLKKVCEHDNNNTPGLNLAVTDILGTGQVFGPGKTSNTPPTYLAEGASDTNKLETGRWRDTSINIVKFDLQALKSPADNPQGGVVRKVVAYYKKEGLGELSTVGGKDCTAAKQEGCYYATCLLDYKTKPDQDNGKYPVDSCAVKSCKSSDVLAGCGPGAYLRGWDDDGVPDCVSLTGLTADANPCPFGTVLTGYDTKKTPAQAICTGQVNCPEGKTLTTNGHCLSQKREIQPDDNGFRTGYDTNSFQESVLNSIISTFEGAEENNCSTVTIKVKPTITYNGPQSVSHHNQGQMRFTVSYSSPVKQAFQDRLSTEFNNFCNPDSQSDKKCKIIKIKLDLPKINEISDRPTQTANPPKIAQAITWGWGSDDPDINSHGIYASTPDQKPENAWLRFDYTFQIQVAQNIKLTKTYGRLDGQLKCIMSRPAAGG